MIEEFLRTHQIDYIHHEHPAVFTCEEADEHCKNVPGLPGKNLFLRSKKGDRYFLYVLPAHKRLNLKEFGAMVEEKKLTFGSPEELMDKLGLTPGSVSPFGLVNDPEASMEVYIDREIYDAEVVNFHPNRNTASLELRREMFHKYLDVLPHHIHIL